ncbi:MAG: hypothetical protein KGO02_09045 [Alphaproteobacteria bacterium]|nr:hypothetical protein [Alphaproteobacteria bacterium]
MSVPARIAKVGRYVRVGWAAFRVGSYLRRRMRKAGLYPRPITDDIISDLLNEYMRQLSAYPNWGEVPMSANRMEALILGTAPAYFDARFETEQAARRIVWRLKGGDPGTFYYSSSMIPDIVLRRHGLMPSENPN